ncbi:uncharacterized protein LOC133193990 [Saccostrea echinata]|uniref:uncharacterized protein LOC133193990 n=1 Tax=Saccostrea echinata TaxID=191078 RepID=UPI002A7F1935|nr:uncharacterized protein LOC133193990 [Saccostrea echinata]
MKEDAQDFVNCEACNNPAEYWYYCNVCHRKFCQGNECLQSHQGEGHNVVRFENRNENRQKQIVYELCLTHPDKILNNFCKSCSQRVCDRCILLNHRDMKKHDVVGLNEIVAERRKILDKNTNILKLNVLPKYVKEIQDLGEEIFNSEETYKVKRNIIHNQHEFWKNEIKKIIDQILADLTDLEFVHLKRLKDQQNSLKETLIQIGDIVQANEELLQSPSELAVHEVRSIENYLEFPEITKFSPPVFTVGQLTVLLNDIYTKGKINYSPTYSITEEELYTKSCIVIAKLSGLTEKIQKKEKILTGVKREMNLLASMEVENHNKIDDISCQFFEAAWLCDKAARKISKLSESGKLLIEKEVKNLGYIASQDNDKIFYSSEDNKLMEFTENLSRVVSNFEWIPFGLSVTEAKDILVCERSESRGRVVKYSSKGHLLKIIEQCKKGEQLFQAPERVIENSNGDVCVTDNCIPASLVVVNNLGEFQFRYPPEENQTSSSFTWSLVRREKKPSSFNGLASDIFGNILISGTETKVIYILDKWGKFLQSLSSKQIQSPHALAVDHLQRLWIVDGENQIKIVAYLNCFS